MRIIPNYYLLILLFLIISLIPFFNDDYFLAGNNVLPNWSYILMLQNILRGHLNNMGNDAMSVTWSIGIEEQFCLIIPLIIYFIKNNWLPILLVFFILLTNLFRYYYTLPGQLIPAYVLLPCRMDAISFGVLIAWINCNYNLSNLTNRYFIKILLTIMGIICLCAVLYLNYQDIGIIRNTLFAAFFSLSIILALSKPNFFYGKILANPTLNWIGKISYSLYLFHYLEIGIFNKVSSHFFINTSALLGICTTLLALVYTILFSWIVFIYLEKPIVAFGKKYNYS